MVSHLVRLLGPAHLSLAEEAVQDSMVRALSSWPYEGVPQNPEGWLYRVAHNSAIDAVRRQRMADAKTGPLTAELQRAVERLPGDPSVDKRLRDDELSLIFMCCHPAIAPDSRVALSLKTACGFSVREIARAFLAEETAIAQRLVRAKKQIREQELSLEMPSGKDIEERIESVLAVLYCMFNEGYSAHEGEDLVRFDLCQEALRLGLLIAGSSLARPKVHALVALMALQSARMPARIDKAGDLVLLEDQDSSRWDHGLIAMGFHHFNLSTTGSQLSRYHIEAALASAHAMQPMNWRYVLDLYDQLLALDSVSPVVRLNRAVAVAKVYGAEEGLRAIEPLLGDPKLREYHLLLAVQGHFLRETGRLREAARAFEGALGCRCSEPEKRFLQGKLEQVLASSNSSASAS